MNWRVRRRLNRNRNLVPVLQCITPATYVSFSSGRRINPLKPSQCTMWISSSVGNGGAGRTCSPANYPGIMAVGAIDIQTKVIRASGSQSFARAFDPLKPNLVAPGKDILSAKLGGGLQTRSSTSMAAAGSIKRSLKMRTWLWPAQRMLMSLYYLSRTTFYRHPCYLLPR